MAPGLAASADLARQRQHELDDERRRHDARLAVGAGPVRSPRAGSSPRPSSTATSAVVVLGATTAERAVRPAASPIGQIGHRSNGVAVHRDRRAQHGRARRPARDEDDQAVVPQTTYASRVSTSSTPGSVSTIYLEATLAEHAVRGVPGGRPRRCSALHGSPRHRRPTSPSPASSRCSRPATSTSKTLTVLLGGHRRRSRCSSAGSGS